MENLNINFDLYKSLSKELIKKSDSDKENRPAFHDTHIPYGSDSQYLERFKKLTESVSRKVE